MKEIEDLKALETRHANELEEARQKMVSALKLPENWYLVQEGGFWCAHHTLLKASVLFTEEGLLACEQYYEDVSEVPVSVVVAVLRANGVIP